MKKVAVIILSTIISSTFVFAASNDVTLTTSVNFSIGGIQVNVTGSSAVIESVTVSGVSFTVGMQSGSAITVTAPNGNQLSATTDSDVAQTLVCSSTSSLTLSATGAASITVTPSSAICAPSSGGSSNGGGVVPPEYLASGSAYSNGDPITQAPTTPTIPTQSGSYTKFIFTRNLRLNVQHPDVLKLQQYLNAQGFKVATSGPGSPGNETDRFGRLTYNALIKFQEAHAIEILKPSGLKKGTGYFGPSTRAFVNK